MAFKVSGNIIINENGAYQSDAVTVSGLTIDCSLGNYFTKSINANSTFTFSNAPSSRAYSFTLEIDHISGTITWPTSVEWPQNSPPLLSTNRKHLFMFATRDGGSRWHGAALTNYSN